MVHPLHVPQNPAMNPRSANNASVIRWNGLTDSDVERYNFEVLISV